MMTGIDILLTVDLLYFVTRWCGPCSEAVPPGTALGSSGCAASAMQQLIPVGAPVLPGREESGEHWGC